MIAATTFTRAINITRTSRYDKFLGSMKITAHIIVVIVKYHLLQIGRMDGPTENLSYIFAAIELHWGWVAFDHKTKYSQQSGQTRRCEPPNHMADHLRGYLAHKKLPTPLGPP